MSIATQIKAARKASNITQKELAQKINKSFSTVQKYELGLATPPTDVLKDIASALDTPLGFLMEYEDLGNGFWGKEASPEKTEKVANRLWGASAHTPEIKERLNAAFEHLNETGQKIAVERIEELSKIPEYRK